VATPPFPARFPGVPTWFSRTPGRVAGAAPELGANTREVLEALGLPAASAVKPTGVRDRKTWSGL
jgi:crotonobetainyl-CoA:carnitine CoA-transferase CaiB-like acyl-CoA transferase